MNDEESELLYNRSRMYNSTAHRFTSRDPIGYRDGTNLYQYIASSPDNILDSSGQCCQFVGAKLVLSGDLAALDGPLMDPMHQRGLATRQLEYASEYDGTKFTRPNLTGPGTYMLVNDLSDFIIKNGPNAGTHVLKDNYLGVAAFFYVDISVRGDTETSCTVQLTEDNADFNFNGANFVMQSGRHYGPYSGLISRIRPIYAMGGPTHMHVFADLPTTGSYILPSAIYLDRMSVYQTFKVTDENGTPVATIINSFGIGATTNQPSLQQTFDPNPLIIKIP